MIFLKELLHTLSERDQNKHDLIPVEKWKFQDWEFLQDMGFDSDGMYKVALKNPEMAIVFQKETGFHLKDKSQNKNYSFPKFSDLVSFFEKYNQKWEDAPYL